MMERNKWAMLGVFMLFSLSASAQSIFGKWKTIDDRTGNPKAIISIYEEDGLMYGHVVEILEEGKENAVCGKCDGKKKGCGARWQWGMEGQNFVRSRAGHDL